jgi:hypothetical protein
MRLKLFLGIVLVVLLAAGVVWLKQSLAPSSSSFHGTSNRAILDAADAIDRLMEFRRDADLVEATRLYQLADREQKSSVIGDDHGFLLLIDYYFSAKEATASGDEKDERRAHVCGAELRGVAYADSKPGDCVRLSHEWAAKK